MIKQNFQIGNFGFGYAWASQFGILCKHCKNKEHLRNDVRKAIAKGAKWLYVWCFGSIWVWSVPEGSSRGYWVKAK